MSTDTLVAVLLDRGLPLKMGKAGQAQRAWNDELATDMLTEHHSARFHVLCLHACLRLRTSRSFGVIPASVLQGGTL